MAYKVAFETYLNFEKVPFSATPDESGDGYTITVGYPQGDFSNVFDKAGRTILKDVTFHILPKARKNKWEVVGYGRSKDLSELSDLARSKLEILKSQMPNFFMKYKEATPEQFALFARKLLRPMRQPGCPNNLNQLKSKLFRA